jgi:hypothetical protein
MEEIGKQRNSRARPMSITLRDIESTEDTRDTGGCVDAGAEQERRGERESRVPRLITRHTLLVLNNYVSCWP